MRAVSRLGSCSQDHEEGESEKKTDHATEYYPSLRMSRLHDAGRRLGDRRIIVVLTDMVESHNGVSHESTRYSRLTKNMALSSSLEGIKNCIFCGRKGSLTGEHIWPTWSHRYLNIRPTSKGWHAVSHSGGAPHPGMHHKRAGDVHSRRLRVVCGGPDEHFCNNGWMSVLQQRAKPILLPMIKGEFGRLSSEEQGIVASWSIMFTMVNEFSDLKTQRISQSQRTLFMDQQEDWSVKQRHLRNWYVWIGDYRSAEVTGVNHHTFSALLPPSPPRLAAEDIALWQTTGFTIGRLFILTVMIDTHRDMGSKWSSTFAEQFGIFRILPTQPPLAPSLAPLSFIDFGKITNYFAAAHGKNPFYL